MPAPVQAQQADHPGKPTYDRWCAGCHGVDGDGQGDAAGYMLPRPRDFTKALYQIRTTASGQLPTDADIRRVIDEGMPGTAMPAWREQLSEAERDNLVAYLKTFSRFFGQGAAPEPLSFGSAPGVSEEAIAEGREFYQSIECWKCHGQEGRGDGQSAPTQTDDEGFPMRPADLTEPWLFNGGATVEDIYRTLRTGLDGTPMPSFGDLLAANFMTDEQLWNVAYYVRSLAPEEVPPRVREVVRAAQVDTLPGEAADSAWNDVERFYIPLVGQIIVKPRWFAPAVDGVWVQAVHDGNEIALRLSWSDPSRSPDPVWADWRQLVESTMEPKLATSTPAAGAPAPASGPAAAESQPAPQPTPLGDAIAVQFPRTIPPGMERPYFFMGSARDPVYVWHWSSEAERATEQLGRGPGRLDPIGADALLSSNAVWEHGQWRLTLRRRLVVGDTAAGAEQDANRLSFATRQPIPMAIFAWDGDNG
ncbi:MAG: c-type cytochrome, partial [Longimicrobiales bacterium]